MGKIEELKLECVGGMRRTREGIGYSSAMLHWRCLLDTQVEILEMQQDIWVSGSSICGDQRSEIGVVVMWLIEITQSKKVRKEKGSKQGHVAL